jgi:hypothetical protein
MPVNCPHCGASLPSLSDAFCSECRACLDEVPEESAEGSTGNKAASLPSGGTAAKSRWPTICACIGALIGLWSIEPIFQGAGPYLPVIALVAIPIFLGYIFGVYVAAVLRTNGLPKR